MNAKKSTLKRSLNPMPKFVLDALKSNRLQDQFDARPPYQRNDYLGWISRAKKPETQQKRLAQMLEELAGGNVYMKMKYEPKSAHQA